MNTFKKASIITTLALALAGTAFAGATPHEKNRQLDRGHYASKSESVKLSEVRGAKLTPHAINRLRSATGKVKAEKNEVNSSLAAVSSASSARVKTPSQRNRNS
ncbi:MAG: hypothetical protein ACPGN3_15800 [Opitutales bacterium]